MAEQIGANIDGAVAVVDAIDGRIEPLQQSLDRVLPDVSVSYTHLTLPTKRIV